MAAPGVVTVGPQLQQNAAYLAYLKYKDTPQKPNVSSETTYPTYENPEYSGKPATKVQNARDVLNERDKQIISSDNALTSNYQVDISKPDRSSYTVKPVSDTVKSTSNESREPLRWLVKEELDAFNKSGKIPTQEDVNKYNNLVDLYNKITVGERAKTNQQNIQSRQSQLNEITQAFTTAKEQGVSKIEILDVNKNVIGTVNPQNIPQARLQYLQMTRKGAVSYRYPITKTETNTTVTTPTYREDPLSLIARPVLAFGAEVGGEIIETFKQGKFTGKTLNPFDLTKPLASEQVQQKTEQTFGVGQEINNLQSNKYTKTQQAAAITGVAIATAIPLLSGVKLEKPPEFINIFKNPPLKTVVKSTEKGFVEVPAFTTYAKERIDKNTFMLLQGTASNKGVEESGYIYTPLKYLRTIQRPPLVKTNELPLEEAITKAPKAGSEIIGIGAKGEPIKTGVYEVSYGMSGVAKTSELSLGIVTREKTTFVTAPTGLEGQKIMVHAYGGASPEMEKQLSSLGFIKEPQLKNTYTAKYTPELANFIEYSQKGEQNANMLFSKQIAELHSYPSKELIKQPIIYGEASRNPETLETGFLPGGANPLITRPEITKFFGIFKLIPKNTNEVPSRVFKPGKPFVQEPQTTKTVKEETVNPLGLESISEKSGGVQTLEKVFSNMEPIKGSAITEDLFYLTGSKYEKTNMSFASKPILSTKIESIPTTLSKSESITDVIQETIKREKYKQENPFGDLGSLSKSELDTSVLTGQKTEQSTNQKQTTKQIQDLVSGTPEISITEKTTIKIPPIEFLSLERTQKKKKTKKGIGINFLGGTPQFDIIGVYKNRDITFGNKKINKITRQERTQAEKPYSKFFKQRKQKLRPSPSNIRWSEKKPKKVKEVKF